MTFQFAPISDLQPLVTDFYPSARRIKLNCPETLFFPDNWTQALAAGLQTLNFTGRNVLEIGVGVGVNMAGLLTADAPPAHFTGVDICTESISVSRALAEREGLDVDLYVSSLLKGVPRDALSRMDEIFACIPQVPAPGTLRIAEADNYAHYYEADGNPYDTYGLGLNAKLIEQATLYSPKAGLTLNLAGRPGEKILTDLFAEYGRKAETIFSCVIEQHAGTSLSSLSELEKIGHEPFEFFEDPQGHKQIDARKAESLRGICPVYHKIYVMRAPGL